MGFRRSTAYKVLPGVRLTIRDPETGRRRPLAMRAAAPMRGEPTEARVAGPLSRSWERRLHRGLLLGDAEGVRRAAAGHGEGLLGTALGGLTAYATGAGAGHQLLRAAWEAGGPEEPSPFDADDIAHVTIRVDLTAGVQARLPVSWDTVGLALVHLERRRADLDAAIAVAEDLDPSIVAALVLADLYLEAQRPEDVVELTEGMTNTDDVTALLLVMRAMALRMAGREREAAPVLQGAIRWGVRDSVVRRLALSERDRSVASGEGGVE
jgi:hypothetical protein